MLMIEDKYGKLMDIFNKFIKEKTHFGKSDYSDTCCEVDDITAYLCWNLAETGFQKLYAAGGVSKVALVSEELTYVLKVPFAGRFYESWNKETESYDEIWEDFQYAPYCNDGSDYCLSEVEIYQKAIEYGVECMFAKTEVFNTLECGLPVYIQERVILIDNSKARNFTPTEDSLTKAKKNFCCEPCYAEWKAIAIDLYGEEFLNKFFDFINDVCPECSEDLHCGNYGFTPDGRPVILDYSGWRD